MSVHGHNAIAVTLDGVKTPVASVEVGPLCKELYGCVSQRIAMRGEHGYGFNNLSRLVNVSLTPTRRGWQFPADRFVTYEPSDEAWARPLGFGHEGYVASEIKAQCAIVALAYDYLRLEVMTVECDSQGAPPCLT